MSTQRQHVVKKIAVGQLRTKSIRSASKSQLISNPKTIITTIRDVESTDGEFIPAPVAIDIVVDEQCVGTEWDPHPRFGEEERGRILAFFAEVLCKIVKTLSARRSVIIRSKIGSDELSNITDISFA